MKFELTSERPEAVSSDLLFIAVTKEHLGRLKEGSGFDREVLQGLTEGRFGGKAGELCHIHTSATNSKRVLLYSLGEESKLVLEDIRKAYGSAASAAAALEAKRVLLTLPRGSLRFKKEDVAKAITEGFVLGSYKFSKYKSEENDKAESVLLNAEPVFKPIIDKAAVVCHNANWVRDLINEPSEMMHTRALVKTAEQLAEKNGLKITILDECLLQEKGMNLIYRVGKGSRHPPHLVIIEYKGAPDSDKKVALVGKGVTLDTGGLNLKPSGHIETMKHDMSGAATILGVVKTAAELKLKVNIIAAIPICENMISPDSYRPGDIVKSYAGKTIEITNTDAEGRLILADAIAYVEKNYSPEAIIDLATLTGSIKATFNEHVAGLFSNNSELAKKLFRAGQITGERVWELPIYQEYEEELKGEVSDLKNCSESKYGGAITGAAFLKAFVDKAKWAHIDIASTAWFDKSRNYFQKGATGFGVRLLTEFLKDEGLQS